MTRKIDFTEQMPNFRSWNQLLSNCQNGNLEMVKSAPQKTKDACIRMKSYLRATLWRIIAHTTLAAETIRARNDQVNYQVFFPFHILWS